MSGLERLSADSSRAEPILSDSGQLLAQEAPFGVSYDRHGLKRFTAFCKDPTGQWGEELDVDAVNARYARLMAERLIATDLVPGCTVGAVEERFGWYM
jgi:hypothetical protein